MKACSKFLSIFLVFVLIFTSISVSAAVTDVTTPDNVSLKWATQVGSGWQKPAGVPVFVNDSIIIMSGDEIYALNPQNGEITKKAQMSESQSYGYVAPTFADNTIFANLSNGTVQAFDSANLESKWTYVDSLGGKGMTGVTYSDKTVFTGFWNNETKDASFVALDSETGELKWQKTINGGLYWAGAYCTDNAVIFATDDGNDKIAYIYSCNKATGEVISRVAVENKGDIRSSVVNYNGRIYLTTKGGYLISAALTNDLISDVIYGEIGAACTSTPVVHDGRIYIGAGDKTVSVFDAATLTKLFAVPVKGYPQCTPLLSTAHVNSEGYIYLYTTYNTTPGGITLIKIKPDATSNSDCIVTELYDADGYSQYCISDIITDDSGNLYYKNDSGYLFALSSNSITVKTSVIEDGFILPQTEVNVTSDLAESYGYTDTVADSASALDVLVKIHADMFGTDFTPETSDDYLSVSAEGYLSRIMCIDTYNFGFAVNGKAPHNDVLTNYGYTGYSLNQTPVNEGDKVEFFLYRDDWALDNYVHFEMDGIDTDQLTVEAGEEITLTLNGYTFAWYSCYEESQIENMMMAIVDADITVINTETGNMEAIARTDKNGNFTLRFDTPGKYIISASEHEDDYPLIAPWLEIDVKGIEVQIDTDKVTIVSNVENTPDTVIIVAEYTDGILTGTIVEHTTLKNYQIRVINTSLLSGDIRVYVWKNKLTPLTEVK